MFWLSAFTLALGVIVYISWPLWRTHTSGSTKSDTWRKYTVPLLIGLTAISLYSYGGRPDLTEPIPSARASRISEILRQAEDHLSNQPSDGASWEAVAPIYLRGGRFGDAFNAFSRAIRLLGESPSRLLGQATALILLGEGRITQPVEALLRKIRKLEPDHTLARFYQGLALDQQEKHVQAREVWTEVLSEISEEHPVRILIESEMSKPSGGS